MRGKNEQINIRKIGTIFPMPNIIIKIGSQPKAGIGYKRVRIGLKVLSIKLLVLIIIPAKIPELIPKINPITTLIKELSKFSNKIPS
jgi:hypothetical protein